MKKTANGTASLNNKAVEYAATGRLNAAILLNKCSVNIVQKVRLNVSGMGNESMELFSGGRSAARCHYY